MQSIFYAANERGHADHGWLNAHHSFSFASYYDAKKVHFGALRVLNDDLIAGAGGFPTHPHDNMEIVTIPLSGAIAHKDSTGGNGIIQTGDVQIMSAGSGVRHSEFNASRSEALSLLQIWVFPKEENIQPRYDQKTFDAANRNNKWQVVVGADEKDGGLWINQDAVFSLADITAGSSLSYQPRFEGNGVYLFMIDGQVDIDGQSLGKRDAIGVWDTKDIQIKASADTKLLAIEVPMLK